MLIWTNATYAQVAAQSVTQSPTIQVSKVETKSIILTSEAESAVSVGDILTLEQELTDKELGAEVDDLTNVAEVKVISKKRARAVIVKGTFAVGAKLVVAKKAPPKEKATSSEKPSGHSNFIGIRVNPFYILLSGIGGIIDVKLFNQFKIGPEGYFYSVSNSLYETSTSMIGGRLTWHFMKNSFTSSPYLGVMAGALSGSTSFATGGGAVGSVEGSYIGGAAGYQWAWNTFYMTLGLMGGSINLDAEGSSGGTSVKSALSGGYGALDFTLGFAF